MLGSLAHFKDLEQRAGPLSVLQKLGLSDQALPLSNFYIKVHLVQGVSDECFVQQLKFFNNHQKEKVFHSVFDGDTTFLVSPPPPPPQIPLYPSRFGQRRQSVSLEVTVARAVLVLEDHPIRLFIPLSRNGQ